MDLKPLYDDAKTTSDEVQKIKNEILALYSDGTEESKEKAKGMRASLEAAGVKADEANKMYITVRDAAAKENGAASNFVPAPQGKGSSGQGDDTKEMTRAEFEALDAPARMKFCKTGGKVTGNAE
jgi:hypothetical protein